jgi:hypothetical protein
MTTETRSQGGVNQVVIWSVVAVIVLCVIYFTL